MLEDLQPYLCTYADCKLPEQLFGSRTAWVLHEDASHRQLWKCRDHHNIAFTTAEAYRSHLEREHQNVEPDHLQAVIESCATVREDDRDLCPLCLIPVSRLGKGQNLIKHIAHHLERISCFALPRNMELNREVGDDDSLRLASDQSDDSRRLSDMESARSEQSDDRQDTDLDVDSAESSNASQDMDEDFLATPLYQACFDGQSSRVLLLLEEGANPNCVVGNGNPLCAASSMGHANIVQLLLNAGADVNIEGGPFGSPLQAASACNQYLVVRLLLDSGADVNARGGVYGSCLKAAAMRGHITSLDLSLERGAEPLTSDEVDQMIEEAWRKSEENGSERHTKDVRSAPLCNLARSLHFMGVTEKAEGFLRRALNSEIETNEEIDLPVLDIIELLGSIYEDQGKWEESEAMYIRSVEGSRSRYGASHRETLRRMRDLADCLRKRGKYQDACEMHRGLLGTREDVLGYEYEDTLESAHDLAVSLYSLKEYVEAENLLRRAMEGRQKHLGPEHFDTLESTCELARVMEALGRPDEAISLYERAGNGFEKTLGPGYHLTKTCREALERLRQPT